MKVSELIEKLQGIDQDLEIYCMTQEEGIMASKDRNVRTFIVEDVYPLAVRQFYDSTFELVAQILDSKDSNKIAAIEFSLVVK